jgi:hypothetical protein
MMFLEEGRVGFLGTPEELANCQEDLIREFFAEDQVRSVPG